MKYFVWKYCCTICRDILLIAPSVSELQELFDACAIELSWLDRNINEKSLAVVSALVHDGM